jgi:hypothetical protein
VPKLFALEQGNQAIRHELPVFLPIVRGDCRHAIGTDWGCLTDFSPGQGRMDSRKRYDQQREKNGFEHF